MDLDLTTGRRRVLAGGAGALAAAFLAACSSDDGDSADAEAAPSTTAPAAPDPLADLDLSLTFASLELVAIDAYQAILEAGRLTSLPARGAAELFLQHHEQHLDAMNSDVKTGGGEEVDEANTAVYDELVAPRLTTAVSEGDAAALLAELELALASTYAWSAGPEGFTAPDLRQRSVTISGVDARHAAVLQVIGEGQAPAEIFPPNGFLDPVNEFADIDGAMLEADEE